MNKFVIYTVLTGGYDKVLQPAIIDNRFDYILFTDDASIAEIGYWTVRSIPEVIKDDNKRLSRYPKSHPETLLSEYDASLYIDANIQINDQWVYERFIELYKQKIIFAGIKLVLTGRDCLYEHAYDMCHSYCLEHDYVAIKQCHDILRTGFPRHFGMNENNVLFRIHTEEIRKTDEEWWWWIVNYSSRDQLSFMYCLWHNKIPVKYFLPPGEDTRNGYHFSLVDHDADKHVIKVKVVRRSLMEKLRVRAFSCKEPEGFNYWIKIADSKYPVMRLYIEGLIRIIIYWPFILNKILNKK